jgi:integrase
MPRQHLTDIKIKSLTAPTLDKPQVNYFDDPAHSGVQGLFLACSLGGTKTWRVMHYLPSGGSRTFKLGRYPVMTLAQARAAALEFLRDPKKHTEQRVTAETFDDVVKKYLALYVKKNNLRTAKVIEQRIAKHLTPKFKDYEFGSIRRRDLVELLDDIEAKNGAPMADAMLTVFKGIATWQMARDEDYRSPIGPHMKRYNTPVRDRVLDDAEIRAFWSATGDLGIFGGMCRVLLLTGQRRAKVNFLRWDDIVDGVWHIRTEPNEKPNPGRIKLPKIVLDIIEAQPHFKKSPFVFSGLRGRGAFIAIGQYVAHLERRMKLILPDMEPHTLHDLRRTFRTRLAQIGVEETLAQRCIGHVVGSKNARRYNHHPFFDEMGVAFQALADHIVGIVTPPPANVVPLTGIRRPQRASIRAVQGGSDASTHDAPR